jgi:hypothetical protein
VARASLEGVAERLLGDERLRGSLTDDQFQPLLDWALAALERAAADGAREPEHVATRRLEAELATVREVLATVDRLAERVGSDGEFRLAKAVARVVRAADARAGLRIARRLAAGSARPGTRGSEP